MMRETEQLQPGELAARRRWAKRRGRHQWLWPEVSPADWRTALQDIGRTVGTVLSQRAPPTLACRDPAALGLACYTCGLGPLLGWWREQGMLRTSATAAALLDLHLEHNRRRMDMMRSASAQLAVDMASEGLPAVIFKGMHTAGAYFPDPATRPLSDIDLLVSTRHREPAERLLARAGYLEAGRTRRESDWRRADTPVQPRTLTFVHAEDPWSVDLHHSLDIPVSGGTEEIALDRLEPMRTGRTCGTNPGFMALEQPLLLLHLAAHAGAGLHNMTLVRLVELHLVIQRDEGTGRLDWGEFLRLGGKADALGYAYPALQLCERLIPGTIPAPVLARCAAEAPPRMRTLVAGLDPALAQRIDRSSVREHFMWAGSGAAILGQLRRDLVQPGLSFKSRLSLYERRAWQLLKWTVSR